MAGRRPGAKSRQVGRLVLGRPGRRQEEAGRYVCRHAASSGTAIMPQRNGLSQLELARHPRIPQPKHCLCRGRRGQPGGWTEAGRRKLRITPPVRALGELVASYGFKLDCSIPPTLPISSPSAPALLGNFEQITRSLIRPRYQKLWR